MRMLVSLGAAPNVSQLFLGLLCTACRAHQLWGQPHEEWAELHRQFREKHPLPESPGPGLAGLVDLPGQDIPADAPRKRMMRRLTGTDD
jgi:hypothetical protein